MGCANSKKLKEAADANKGKIAAAAFDVMFGKADGQNWITGDFPETPEGGERKDCPYDKESTDYGVLDMGEGGVAVYEIHHFALPKEEGSDKLGDGAEGEIGDNRYQPVVIDAWEVVDPQTIKFQMYIEAMKNDGSLYTTTKVTPSKEKNDKNCPDTILLEGAATWIGGPSAGEESGKFKILLKRDDAAAAEAETEEPADAPAEESSS